MHDEQIFGMQGIKGRAKSETARQEALEIDDNNKNTPHHYEAETPHTAKRHTWQHNGAAESVVRSSATFSHISFKAAAAAAACSFKIATLSFVAALNKCAESKQIPNGVYRLCKA